MAQPVFTKAVTPRERLEVEAMKTLAAAELARGLGSFAVPELVGVSETTITTSFVGGLVSLADWLRSCEGVEEASALTRRTGRVLAQIHAGLEVGPPRILMPEPLGANDVVAIHGDFGLRNVHYHPAADELVVIDWSTPAWISVPATHGSSAWDVGLFITGLGHRRPRDPVKPMHPRILGRQFLVGYEQVRRLPPGFGAQLTQVMRLFWGKTGSGPGPYARIPNLVAQRLMVSGYLAGRRMRRGIR